MPVRLHELVLLLGEHIFDRTQVLSIATECGLSLATLDLHGAPRDWWGEMLRKAREAQRLEALLDLLRGRLRAVADRLVEPEEWASPCRRPPIHQPGGRYDPYWDVGREELEARFLRQLEGGAAPIAISGPRGYGKTWFLERLRARFLAQHPKSLVLRIDSEFFQQSHNGRPLFERFARQIVQQAGGGWQKVEGYWDPLTQDISLQQVWRRDVFKATDERVLMTLDVPQVFWSNPEHADFFGLVRSWVNSTEPPWSRLRLVMAYSTEPALWLNAPTRSPLNVLATELPDFTDGEVISLAARYELAWSEREVVSLMEKTGGYPLLCADFLFFCHERQGWPFDRLLRTAEQQGGVFYRRLKDLAELLRSQPELVEALKEVHYHGRRPGWQAYRALHSAGMIRYVEGHAGESRFVLRFPLLLTVLGWL